MAKETSRKERWSRPKQLVTFLQGEDEERLQLVSSWQQEDKGNSGLTHLGVIEAAKELIFDIVDGVPLFHVIMVSFCTQRGAITVDHLLDVLIDGDRGEQHIEEEVTHTLALASASEVPVYANRAEVADRLSHYHRQMLINGFTAPDKKGNRVRLMLTRSPRRRIDDPRYIAEIDATQSYAPSEIALMQRSVVRELSRLTHATAMLSSLARAIEALRGLLGSETRNEHKLQRCLTENPILFGTEYLRVIPKHRLGSEFEMDYALQKPTGVVDLVEIESSTLRLFTKRGNPTKYLVHAEQQVIDWLTWIEKNHAYAESNLPGLYNPCGFVVIGRSTDLHQDDVERIHRRNQLFKGQIQILTFDHLLDRAEALRSRLEGVTREGHSAVVD